MICHQTQTLKMHDVLYTRYIFSGKIVPSLSASAAQAPPYDTEKRRKLRRKLPEANCEDFRATHTTSSGLHGVYNANNLPLRTKSSSDIKPKQFNY